jgi:hypothetical protein
VTDGDVTNTPRRRTLVWGFGILLAALLSAAIVGTWLANEAGMLPWQPEPTRISEEIVPFQGIPGFGDPTPTP